jgi:hypothetical protein
MRRTPAVGQAGEALTCSGAKHSVSTPVDSATLCAVDCYGAGSTCCACCAYWGVPMGSHLQPLLERTAARHGAAAQDRELRIGEGAQGQAGRQRAEALWARVRPTAGPVEGCRPRLRRAECAEPPVAAHVRRIPPRVLHHECQSAAKPWSVSYTAAVLLARTHPHDPHDLVQRRLAREERHAARDHLRHRAPAPRAGLAHTVHFGPCSVRIRMIRIQYDAYPPPCAARVKEERPRGMAHSASGRGEQPTLLRGTAEHAPAASASRSRGFPLTRTTICRMRCRTYHPAGSQGRDTTCRRASVTPSLTR